MGSNISFHLSEDVELRELLVSAAAVLAFMVLFVWHSKHYDLSTGMFFAYGLGAMARGKMGLYYGLFPLACVNRETTLLMSAVYAVWFFGKAGGWGYVLGGAYQAVIFGLVRFMVTWIYAMNPGVDFMFDPLQNLEIYLENPVLSLVHWGAFALVIGLFVRRWAVLSHFVRTAFAVMLPVMLVNYLVLGWAFEVRVFWEIVPVVACGMMKAE